MLTAYDLRLALTDAHEFGAYDLPTAIAQADADYGDDMTWAEIADAIPSWDAIAARLRCPDLAASMHDALDSTTDFGLPLESTLTSHEIPEEIGRRYLMEHPQQCAEWALEGLDFRSQALEPRAEVLRAFGVDAEVYEDDFGRDFLEIEFRPNAYKRDKIAIRPVVLESEDPYIPNATTWRVDDGSLLGPWLQPHDVEELVRRTLIVLWTTNEW